MKENRLESGQSQEKKSIIKRLKLLVPAIGNAKRTLKDALIIICTVLVLGFIVLKIGIPGFSSLFQATSPWSQQQKDITNKNNVRDTYSAIIGSEVGLVSQNGIINWFSSKEAKEIDISIPKLINYSPLFEDESERNVLKESFEKSINEDVLSQSASIYQISYDGNLLGKWKNGKKISSYQDLKEIDKNNIEEDLAIRINNEENLQFSGWSKVNKIENVDWDFKNESNIVHISGRFEAGKIPFIKKEYKVDVAYKITADKWTMEKNSLKVEEVE